MKDIEDLIEKKHFLKHPFYQNWSEGQLSMETLREYALNYYSHVRAFPRYLSSVHARMEDDEKRKLILENLIEEEGGVPNHPDLWRAFAHALGAKQVEQHDPIPSMQKVVSHYLEVCQNRSLAEAVAALYAYESQIPEVSEEKIKGLKKYYGMKDPESWIYFSVHIEADKLHRAQEKKLLECMVNKENQATVLHTVDETLDCLNGFLTELVDTCL